MEFITELQKHIALETIYYIFALLMCFDVITGVIKAWKQGKFKSRTMRDGLFGSIGELVLLLLLITIATIIPVTTFIVFALLMFMTFKELGSIAENLQEIGVKLPTWALKGLQVYTNKLDNLEGK